LIDWLIEAIFELIKNEIDKKVEMHKT